MLPRVKGKAADVQGATEAKPLEAITADGQHFLNFFMNPKEPDRVLVKDVQGNTGKVLKDSGSEVGNVAIYGIDTVMLSGKEEAGHSAVGTPIIMHDANYQAGQLHPYAPR